jgi:outer membrane protein OmpA-like peptidoglycan-associated protein
MRYKAIAIIFLLALPGLLHAQTAQALEELLETHAVSNQQAAWLVLEAANIAATSSRTADAFSYAMERQWLPGNARAASQARLDDVSLLIMRAFSIKGGVMYSFLKTPRYAYRELVFQNLLMGRLDPEMAVSGYELLFLVNRVIAFRDDGLLSRTLNPEQIMLEKVYVRLAALDIPNSAVRLTAEGITIDLNIRFNADSAVIMESALAQIRNIAELLTAVNAHTLLISGHAALAGGVDPMQLTIDRAQAVKDQLLALGNWQDEDITVRGFGAERPIADNDTPEGMARNRRVEITIVGYL